MEYPEILEYRKPRRYGGHKHAYKPIPKMKGCKDC